MWEQMGLSDCDASLNLSEGEREGRSGESVLDGCGDFSISCLCGEPYMSPVWACLCVPAMFGSFLGAACGSCAQHRCRGGFHSSLASALSLSSPLLEFCQENFFSQPPQVLSP